MAHYKKKKHSLLFSAPKPKRQAMRTEKTEKIKMTPAEQYRKTTLNTNMKVVKGKKAEQKRRLRVALCSVLVIALIFGVLQIVLPIGVIETASSTISLIGTGSYPVNLEGSQTVSSANKGSYYYVLSNSHLTALSNSGKILFSYPHGFENPVLETSSSRAIVFEQNGNRAFIFGVTGLKLSIDSKQAIICAAISDNGNYALCCKSKKYVSAVTVYNKRQKQLYEWYSAENTVNNIALSPNGKKLAVASFKAENGQFKSVLNILNYKSATPLHSESFDSGLIYNLDNNNRILTVVSEKALKFIKWSSFKAKEYKNEYPIAMFRAEKNGFIGVFNRLNDKTDNHIVLLSKSGKIKDEFQYKGAVTDVALSGNNIYLMSETNILLFGKKGEALREASCGFGAVRISATASNTVAVITDNKIEKVKLEQE